MVTSTSTSGLLTKAAESRAPRLTRALKLRDLVLFNLVAVLGLRHLGTAAKYGPGSIVIWIIAGLFFFIPQGLAVIELSSRFPEEGGIYCWTKRALGEGHAFLCGWCYWVNNALYYPNLLLSTAVIATYIDPRGPNHLSENWVFVITLTLVGLWVAVILNIVGVGTGKWLQNVGAIGTYVPGVMLVLVAICVAFAREPANTITTTSMTSSLTDFSALNLLATFAFAFAGLELSATMGNEIENPRRNLPRSIFIVAPFIAAAYIVGTIALLWILPSANVNVVSGFLDALAVSGSVLGRTAQWAVVIAAALYTIGNIGGIGAWLTGTARVGLVVGLDRYFPPAFARIHPRWGTPYVAILVQAVLSTIFLMTSVLGQGSIEHVYFVLLDTQLLIYFIPYLYLFVCFLLHRQRGETTSATVLAPGGKFGVWALTASGLIVTIFAMAVAIIAPPGNSPWLFALKVIGGATATVLLGGVIYWRAKATQKMAS